MFLGSAINTARMRIDYLHPLGSALGGYLNAPFGWMNYCACLLLYTLLLSCSDACGLKVGVSPGPAFGRITSQNNLLNGIASGIGPGPHQCSHRKTKGTVLSNGLLKAPLLCRSWLPPALCRAQLHHRRDPDEKFLSLNRWRQPSEVLSRNWW